MYLYVVFSIFLNSLLISLFGKFLGRKVSILLSVSVLIITAFLSVLLLSEILLNNNILIISFYSLCLINNIKIEIGFLFDQISVIMLFIILFISMFVHLFVVTYMKYDPNIIRFIAFLGYFTYFMILLVTSDNFFQLFVGWEGVGLCSYLLINFWFNRIAANKAALKAMLVNRIADVFFIFAIILVLYYFKSVNYMLIFGLTEFFENSTIFFLFFNIRVIDLILFFLFLGAIGKSAQIGFHVWLPDAMEGPTPVSSLLHAATMVTAGVFLLIRLSYIFENSSIILFLIVAIGAFTALLSALTAIFQYDIKKIVAYSTCSQLGYMFMAVGLSRYDISLFHLFNHAFFKALLFLGAASIISCLYDEQDIRRMGFLASSLSFTCVAFLIGSLAILGVPFLSGFYSKDLLLEIAWTSYSIDSIFIYLISLVTALCTSIYSFKLFYLVFFKNTNIYNKNIKIIEDNKFILLVLFLLSIFSIFIGYLFSSVFTSIGNNYFSNIIYIDFKRFNSFEIEFISFYIKNLPFAVILIGWLVGFFFFIQFNVQYKYRYKSLNKFAFIFRKWIYYFFYYNGFYNEVYNKIYLIFYILYYKVYSKIIEKGFFEIYGPFGIYVLLRKMFSRWIFLSPYFLNFSLFLIFLYLLLIFFYITLIFYISIKYIYFILIIYYILF